MIRTLAVILILSIAIPTLAVNNPYGVHTLSLPSGVYDWASSLTGPGGYCKLFFYGINNSTSGPSSGWANSVQSAYNHGMNVIVRIGTSMQNGYWLKPVADPDGHYTAFAQAVKRVVQGLPRQDGFTLNIEVLNEVNSDVEWSNDPNPAEYGRCLVDVHDAIDSIGDTRIKVVTAGLAGGSAFLDQMFTQVPQSVWAWDYLASHNYAMNHPPDINRHNGYMTDICIDSYQLDLNVAAAHGRAGAQVMITETGYMLGDASDAGYPTIDEETRADYIMRAFRDYWSKWPEVLAVTPFEFRDNGWQNFDWVSEGSGTDSYGRPTNAHRQYYDVWNLAKPTMSLGAISGKITESAYGAEVEGAVITLSPSGRATTSNAKGNYFFPDFNNPTFLTPGTYSIVVSKPGYAVRTVSNMTVSAGQNTVMNVALTANTFAVLTGTVRDPITDLGLPGVLVSLSPGGRSAVTGADGTYTIDNLTPSTYTLSASKTGFRPYSVNSVTASAGATGVMNFYLCPGQEPAGSPLISTGEMDTGTNGLADGWEAWDAASHPDIYTVDTTQRISGRASQRVKAGGDCWAGEWTNYGACTTGVRYRVEAWVKTFGTTSPAMVACTWSRWGEGTIDWFECYPQMTGTTGWTLFVGTSVAPYFIDQNNGRLRVEIHPPASGGGYAWFDRVWVGRDPNQSDSPICSAANFRATAGEASVTFYWTNPPSSVFPAFAGTVIRRMTDRYPVTPTEGTLVADVPSTSSTVTDTNVTAGTRYYYTAFTHASGGTNYSKGSYTSAIPADSSPPTTPTVTDDGAYTTLTSIHAAWSSSDPQSGVSEYQYAVGTTAGASDVVDWTSAATSTERTIAATLLPDQDYFVSVRAVNGVGTPSAIGTSDGIKAAAASSIGAAKEGPAGSAVYISDAVVTSQSSDFPALWIESADRSAGIRADGTASYLRGDRLQVAGIVTWADGVPMLTDVEFKGSSSGLPLSPAGLNNSALAPDRTESLLYSGLNPVGLLVTSWGEVTGIDTTSRVFYVDDGTGLQDGTGPSNDPYRGLGVAYGAGVTPPQSGSQVRITGIRTVEKLTLSAPAVVNGLYRDAGTVLYIPVIQVRDQDDIVTLQ